MPAQFNHRRFPNGLDLIAESVPGAHSVAVGMFVSTGSRDEPIELNGVSHFLEHMMFKGSERYTWEDVNRIFDEMGANYNAYTSQEMTGYYAAVLPEFTPRAIEHLSHLLRPALRQADFDTEKKVITEEIAMYLDDPGHRIYEHVMASHFEGHPLSQSVLGTVASVEAIQRDAMEGYFRERYGPGNMVVAVAGNIDFEAICQMVQEHCGSWSPVSAAREQRPPQYKARHVQLSDPKLNRQYSMGLLPGPSAQDERRFAARVLADVIGDSDGSRLYWALVDCALAEEADFGFYPHDRCGSFYFSLTNEPARSQQVMDVLLRELARVKEDLGEAEVERAKNKIASQLVLGGELPLGRMRRIGGQWLYNHDHRSLEQDMAILRSLSVDSLKQLMREFPFEPMTIATLGPR